jgi:hypothetical protein
MLLLGALFALLVPGFWLYCLADVALTPGDECRGLPKAAWVAIVAGTFAIGAIAWLAARQPARATPAPLPGDETGSDAGGGAPLLLPLEGRDRSLPRSAQLDRHGRDGTGAAGSLEAEAALLRHPAGRSRPRGSSGRPRPKGPDDDPGFFHSLDRVIHGTEAGDDPAGWAGDEP